MKKVLLILLSFAVFIGFSASTAFAGVYLSGNMGSVFLDDANIDGGSNSGELAFDSGIVTTFAVGTIISSAWRVEGEFGYRKNDLDKMDFDSNNNFSWEDGGDVTALSMMGNGYYDFNNRSRFSPFVGAGLGFANVEYDLDSMDHKDDDNVVAYQLILGVGFAATEKFSVDLQYRYFATADPEIDGNDVEYHTHNVMLGLRYSF